MLFTPPVAFEPWFGSLESLVDHHRSAFTSAVVAIALSPDFLWYNEQINDFLEQHINKLRYDRFEQAVQQSFEAVKPNHESWIGAKEEAGSFLRQWYRTTHGVNSFSNAEVRRNCSGFRALVVVLGDGGLCV